MSSAFGEKVDNPGLLLSSAGIGGAEKELILVKVSEGGPLWTPQYSQRQGQNPAQLKMLQAPSNKAMIRFMLEAKFWQRDPQT